MKNRLEELRKQRGIKQEDLATALEVSRLLVNKNFFNAHVKISGNFERQLNRRIITPILQRTDCLKKFLFTRRIPNEK